MSDKSDKQMGWIVAIRDKGNGLTAWELEFVDLVEALQLAKIQLSVRQAKILETIYTEKTP